MLLHETRRKRQEASILLLIVCVIARFLLEQVSIMEGELRRKMREYEVKLESCEDGSRRTISELRQMLTAQQRVASK